jgi:hypothetical protein
MYDIGKLICNFSFLSRTISPQSTCQILQLQLLVLLKLPIAIYHFKKMNVLTALGATIRIGRKCTREEIHKGWPGSQLTT